MIEAHKLAGLIAAHGIWSVSDGKIAYDLVNEIEITDGSITLKEIFSATLLRQSTISLSR